MGGRAAEELIFGYDKVTTGASSDIAQATNMARSMVTRWGLSDKIGTVDYGEEESGKFYAAQKTFSEETGKIIDEEIKRIIAEALQNAKNILKDKKADLEKLAQALLEYETLSGDEIKDILAGKEIRKNFTQASATSSASTSSFVPNVSDAAI
jgi:cell division protease FtsH